MRAEVPVVGELSQAIFRLLFQVGICGPAWFGMNKEVAQLHELGGILVSLLTLLERLPAERIKNELELVKEPVLFHHLPNNFKGIPFTLGQRAAGAANWEGSISR
jgi:hypothetical protein